MDLALQDAAGEAAVGKAGKLRGGAERRRGPPLSEGNSNPPSFDDFESQQQLVTPRHLAIDVGQRSGDEENNPGLALCESPARKAPPAPPSSAMARGRRARLSQSMQHPLARSYQNGLPTASLAAGDAKGNQFHREVFDVHTEIDKLLGGLKVELDNWRSEFECLQRFWFARVMRCESEGEAEPPVGLRSLCEFQLLLERHVEETDLDAQELEEALRASEDDRSELQGLLEEGSKEVQSLERRLGECRRDLDKKASLLSSRDQELRAKRQSVQELERRCSQAEEECARKVGTHEKALEAAAAEAASGLAMERARRLECELEARKLQSFLDSKQEECSRKEMELQCKEEEIRFLQENQGERKKTFDAEVQRMQQNEADRRQRMLAEIAALEKSLEAKCDAQVADIRCEYEEKLERRQREQEDAKSEALFQLQVAHERALEAAASEAAAAAAMEKAQRIEGEQQARAREERCLREATRLAEQAADDLKDKIRHLFAS